MQATAVDATHSHAGERVRGVPTAVALSLPMVSRMNNRGPSLSSPSYLSTRRRSTITGWGGIFVAEGTSDRRIRPPTRSPKGPLRRPLPSNTKPLSVQCGATIESLN